MSRRLLPAALLAVVLTASGCSDDAYVAPPPAQTSDVADASAAAGTLAAFQRALEDGDAAAAGALGSDDGAAALLASVADNAADLGLSDVTFRYVTETGRTDGTDGWEGEVALTWRLDGFDDASARLEVPFSFAAGGERIAAIGSGTGRLPSWLAGPVTVGRDGDVLVVVAGADVRTDRLLRGARRALAQVREVLPGRSRLVVEVPADTAGLHRALGASPGDYAAIAAITAPVDGSQVEDSPVHVYLNPPVYDDLDATAAQVVLTHEAVHAVTGAALVQQAPMWLVEGFADHVALRDVDLPISRTAGQIIRQVREDGVPASLPALTDFDPAGSHLGTVYEAAWQVCATIADHAGERALVTLYESVLDGTPLAEALRQNAGWSEAELTAAWQQRLASLAGVPG